MTMIGFQNCCCNSNACIYWQQDFSKMPDGPIDEDYINVVSGEWEVIDGCLQTSSDNALVTFRKTANYDSMVCRKNATISVESLGDGSQMTLRYGQCSTSETYNYYVTLTGGSSGFIERGGSYGNAPTNLSTPIDLQWSDSPEYTNLITGKSCTSWYGRTYLSRCNNGADAPQALAVIGSDYVGGPFIFNGIGTKSLNGNPLRISNLTIYQDEDGDGNPCLPNVSATLCQNCGLSLGTDNGGYYVTLQGFSGTLSPLNGTYYFGADASIDCDTTCPRGTYTFASSFSTAGVKWISLHVPEQFLSGVKGPWVDISVTNSGCGTCAPSPPDALGCNPAITFRTPDAQAANGSGIWCRWWNEYPISEAIYNTRWILDPCAIPASEYSSATATITSGSIYP